jgi:hypothetical protein
MMEAVRITETSANFYHTKRHNIPEDINIHSFKRIKVYIM